MSEPSSESHSHVPHLDSVSLETIAQFESATHDGLDLYKDLFEHNDVLAQWVRRRAKELAPDLEDTERQSLLALELAGLIIRRGNAEALQNLFDESPSSTDPSSQPLPKQRQVPDILFEEGAT